MFTAHLSQQFWVGARTSSIRLRTLLLLAAMFASFVAIQESSHPSVVAQSKEQNLEVNIEPDAYLSVVDGSIHVGHQTKAQIVVTNSAANKLHLTGYVDVEVPKYISITGATSGASGGRNFIQIPLSPIAPGSASPIDVFLNATNSSIGEIPMIKATVKMWPVGSEIRTDPFPRELVMYLHIKPSTQLDCEGIDPNLCNEKDFYDARFYEPLCTNLRCEPWGEYLIVYAAIALTLMGINTIRSTFDKAE
jgi:hypothetical protein